MVERKRQRELAKERRDEVMKKAREEKARVELRQKEIQEAEKEGLIGSSRKCGKCKVKVVSEDVMLCALCYKRYHTICCNSDGFLCRGCLLK